MSEKFGFGKALEHLEAGRRVARDGWNGQGMFVYLVPPASYPVQTGAAKAHFGEGSMVPYRAYFAIKTAQDDVATWVPSVGDALAKDWFALDADDTLVPAPPTPGFSSYRSHKVVEAAEIVGLEHGRSPFIDVHLVGGRKHEVGEIVFTRGRPHTGDFLLIYEDGYVSWSPRQAFLDGYTRISDE